MRTKNLISFKERFFSTFKSKIFLILISFCFLYFISYFFIISPKIKNYLVENEKEYYKTELKKMSKLINYYTSTLKNFENDLIISQKEHLEKTQNILSDVIMSNYKNCKDEKEVCLNNILEYINILNKKNKTFTELNFITNQNLENKINNLQGKLPNKKEILEGTYLKLIDSNKKELAYLKYLKEFDINIMISERTSSLNKKLEKRKNVEINKIKDIIKKIRIQDMGYILILDKKNKKFLHPIKKFDNKDIEIFNLLNGQNAVEAARKAHKNKTYIEYFWKDSKTSKLETKIAWVSYNKYFDWYIISSTLKSELYKDFKDINNKIILISILTFLLIFIIMKYVTKQITAPLYILLENIKTFQEGDYNETSYKKITSNDEFALVSNNFYKMKEKIIDNINYLENQITKRTLELKQRLYYDSLTEQKNIHSLIDDMKNQDFCSIILIDLNNFRDLNELYGYEMGSLILKKFAKDLEYFKKKYDFELYRIDGVTFAFLKTGPLEFEPFCEKINKILDKMNNFPIYLSQIKDNIFLSITLGVSICQDIPLRTAFSALNKAKRENHSYCLFNNEIDEKELIEKNLYWSKKIKTAISNKNVVPFFQAIVDKDRNIIKYETLMRIKEDDKNYISPINFLEISKKTKQYNHLSHMIISKALKKLQDHKHCISINMNFSDTQNRQITNLLDSKLINSKIGERLTIEILEDDEIQDYENLKNFIKKYKALGVKFAIDDFGSGYSNVLNILEINPDYIKIDGSLIKNIDTDLTSFKLVKSIVKFSEEMNIKVIAEFVHNEVVFNKLKNLKIHGYQGYYFSEPDLNF